MKYCGCTHDESRHRPGGPCEVTLPAFEEEELPPWRCPCRGYTAEPSALSLLRSVQSCTVGAAARASHQRIRGPIIPGDARVPAGNRLWRLGRTPA